MNESKSNTCKYPKCKKEIPNKKGFFCSYHHKLLNEKGKKTLAGASMLTSVVGVAVLSLLKNDKK